MNKVILLGNVGKEPEVNKLDSGISVAKITLATNETYKDKSGEKQTKTEWHNIVFWGKLAEVIEKYVTKGKQILVEGKITYRSYEKDGEKKYFTEIVANNFEFVGGQKNSNEVTKENNTSEDNDEIPF